MLLNTSTTISVFALKEYLVRFSAEDTELA
jgi:hypothetical protein